MGYRTVGSEWMAERASDDVRTGQCSHLHTCNSDAMRIQHHVQEKAAWIRVGGMKVRAIAWALGHMASCIIDCGGAPASHVAQAACMPLLLLLLLPSLGAPRSGV